MFPYFSYAYKNKPSIIHSRQGQLEFSLKEIAALCDITEFTIISSPVWVLVFEGIPFCFCQAGLFVVVVSMCRPCRSARLQREQVRTHRPD